MSHVSGPIGAPTREDLLKWRGMLERQEIRPRGFTMAEAFAWIDRELAAHDARTQALADSGATAAPAVSRETHAVAV